MKNFFKPGLVIAIFFLFISPLYSQQYQKPLLLKSQAADLAEKGEYLKAAVLYDSAVYYESHNKKPNIPFIAGCKRSAGECYEKSGDYATAIFNYNESLKRYQQDSLTGNYKNLNESIIRCHDSIKQLNIMAIFCNPNDRITADIHYRIDSVELQSSDSAIVWLYTGTNDGIFTGAQGEALGTETTEMKGRGNLSLGKAEVISAEPNITHVRISLSNSSDSTAYIYKGDMIRLPAHVVKNDSPSIFYRLALLNIDFLDNYRNRLYHVRHLLYFDSPGFEQVMLHLMMADVKETVDYIKPLAADNPAWTESSRKGRFKGLNLIEAMEQSSVEDILAFLRFVESFPGKYMGHSWKINETYATWIINGTPLSSEEMKKYLLAADDATFCQVLQGNIEDFNDGDFFSVWDDDALSLSSKGYFDEAYKINSMLIHIAQCLNDNGIKGSALFNTAKILDDQQEYSKAADAYAKAREYYKIAGDLTSESWCVNNIARDYTSLSRYSEALNGYEESLGLKLKRLETDNSSSMKESLSRSYEGKGISLYYLSRYDESLLAFQEAVKYYILANTLNGLKGQAFDYGWMGDVLTKQGNYNDALAYYTKKLDISRQMGVRSDEADAIDNMAYINSLKGLYKEASDLYQQAYSIKLDLDDKNGAGFSRSNVGQMLWSLGDYTQAIIAHQESIELRKQANNRKGQAYSWEKLGDLYQASGDPLKAIAAYDTAASLNMVINNKQAVGSLYNSIGNTYCNVKDYVRAVNNYTKALAIFDTLSARIDYAQTLLNIGNAYYSDKKFNNARDYFSKSLAIQNEIGDKSGQIYNYINLGLINQYFDYDYSLAEQNYQKSLSLSTELESKSYIAYCKDALADMYSFRGESDKALSFYNEALTTYQEIGEKSSVAKTLIAVGYHYTVNGDFTSARKYFNTALQVAEEINNRNQIASAYAGIGQLMRLTGDFSGALETINKSLKIGQEVDNQWGIADAYISLGNTYNNMGEYQNAITYYLRSDSIYQIIGDEMSRAYPVNNIGTIYYYQNDYDRALKQFMQALKAIDKPGLEGDFLSLLKANIGEVYYETKNYNEALKWLDESLLLARKLDNRLRIGSAQLILGKLYTSQNSYSEAHRSFEEAEKDLQFAGEMVDLAELYYQKGKLFYQENNTDSALVSLQKSIDISRSIGSKTYLWTSLYYSALIYKDKTEINKSIDLLKEAAEVLENLSSKIAGGEEAKKIFQSGETRLKVYELIVDLLSQQNRVDEAITFLEKGNNENLKSKFGKLDISYSDENKNDAVKKDKEMKAKLDQIEQELIKEKSKPQELQNAALINKLEEIRNVSEIDYNSFINETIKGQPSLRNYFSRSVNPIEFRAEKRNIPDDMAVLLYLIGDHSLFVFAATYDTVFAHAIEIERPELEGKIRDLHALLIRPSFTANKDADRRGTKTLVTADEAEDNEAKFKDLSSELYQILIGSVLKETGQKQKLVIIPNGVLYYIPFQVLGYPVGDSSFRYLAEDCEIVYTNKLRSIYQQVTDLSQNKIVALGNADKSLPFAEKEVMDIQAIYPDALVYVENEATRDKVYNIPGDYNILHLATHGVFDYNSFENSYLLLASDPQNNDDGKLKIEDIYQIQNLETYRMVTLSACETAVTFDMLEGWPVTTASAFLDLGVTSVIATLWSVDDEATNILMKKFYENLRTMDKLDALCKAQRDLINDPQHNHPYFWAPFLLMGDWK